MSNLFKLFIFCLGVTIIASMTQEINFEDGLKADDLIEWKGVISTKRAPAQLYITAPYPNTRSYSVMKMQIQGARNRLAFSAGIRGRESIRGRKDIHCHLGKNLVAPDMPFRVIIRVLSRDLMVYWNGELKFTLPFTSNAQNIRRISNIRVYGSVKTEELRILTDENLAQELQDNQCGEITTGKKVPDFCPSTRSGCRIVGGGPAVPGKNPWQAAIRKKTVTANQEPHVCGATLINECWALTAGHCFTSTSSRALEELVLRVGDYYNEDNSANSKDSKAENSQDLEIEKVIQHQAYQTYPTSRNDIALVKLKKCATYSEFVKPACLPKSSSHSIDGTPTRCGVSGWGATNSTQQRTSQHPSCLQSASVRVKSVSTCKNAYQDNFDENSMLCAGGPGCADTCQGDSGGPLICAFGAKPRYTLWGITSWGIGCGESRTPGVYTRITSYIRWLYLNMKLSPDDLTYSDLVLSRNIERYYCQHRQS